jgi:hypothetical protein
MAGSDGGGTAALVHWRGFSVALRSVTPHLRRKDLWAA